MDDLADAEIAALLDAGQSPAAPSALSANEEAAVAVWRRDDIAAILFISHDPTDDEEPFSQDIEVFEHCAGRWLTRGRGGSDWPVAYGSRPALRRPALTGYSSGLPQGLWPGDLWVVSSGIAPPGVERVRVALSDFVEEVSVEPTTGAFLVGLPDLCPPLDAFSAA